MNAAQHRFQICKHLGHIALCLLALPGISGAQNAPPRSATPAAKRVPYFLGMLVEQANWDAAQRGPLLALDPVLTYHDPRIDMPAPGPDGYDLRLAAARFHRMLVAVGTISVLAPTEMTRIEDTPHERPNLYDGLPRALKVKYLMSTLTAAQWKTLGDTGLGVGDLNGEQQPVYLSLLPDPFVLTRIPLHVPAGGDDRHTYITLTPEQRAQVRLRVNRQAQVHVPVQNDPHRYMYADAYDTRPGVPNGVKWQRNTQADEEKTDLFGVNLVSVVPNRLKPSQLDYASARLNASIALDGAATLGDLIGRIREGTHVEVYADGRVARLPLLVRGTRARSGDVLQALALAVTGTYRKVDTAYVLTSDLTGIGTRQMRLAEWQWQIKEQTEKLEKELTAQILQHSGANGGVRALGYAPNDPYPLTPALEQQALKHSDVPAALLPPALQQMLRDAAAQNEKQSPDGPQMRDDTARIDIFWRFAFQVPNGAILPSEANIVGYIEQYYAPPESRQAASGVGAALDLRPFAPRPLPASSGSRALFVTPRSLQEAETITQTARQLGFNELVLYTEEQTVLKAAIVKAGKGQRLRIYAAVAPFAADTSNSPNPAIQDVNLMGETVAQVGAVRAVQPRWNTHLKWTAQGAIPRLVPERIGGVTSAIAPVGPDCAARFGKIADLARTEGLAGLFLYDTQPDGYASRRDEAISTNDQVLLERGDLGYSPALRLAFLRYAGADPLDLTPPNIDVDVDLLLPFFSDRVAAHRSPAARQQSMWEFTPQKGVEWDMFRAETNRKAMTDLFVLLRQAAPALPLLVEARAALNNVADAYRLWPAWVGWTQPDNLPTGTSLLHSDKRPPLAPGARYLFPTQFSSSDLLPARSVLRDLMERVSRPDAASNKEVPFALDFRFVPTARALALLNECIAPAAQTQK